MAHNHDHFCILYLRFDINRTHNSWNNCVRLPRYNKINNQYDLKIGQAYHVLLMAVVVCHGNDR